MKSVSNVQTLVREIKAKQTADIANIECDIIGTEELFGLDEALPGFEEGLQVPKIRHALAPEIEDYVFSPGMLRRVLLSMIDNDPIMLVGEKGSGKSAFVTQLLARLNQPLLPITCSAGVMDENLLGRLDYDGEKVTSVDGIVTYGLRKGYNVLLDEVSALRPAVSIGLNDCLEKGDLITLRHHGFNPDVSPESLLGSQIIVRHRSAKIWATDNTGGLMSRDPRFGGTNTINEAVRSRFTYFKCNYMPKEQEFKALMTVVNNHRSGSVIQKTVLDGMIEFANRMRLSQEKGECIGGFSFRELKRWVTKTLTYGNFDEAFCDAAFSGMEEVDQQTALFNFVESFGREVDLPEEQAFSSSSQLPAIEKAA